MTLFKPQVGNVNLGQTTGEFTVITFFLVESVLKYTYTLKTPCLQKFNFFIWKCTHNRLPTHSFIAHHQHGIGFECFRCLNLESTLHVIQDYPWAKEFWIAFPRQREKSSFS